MERVKRAVEIAIEQSEEVALKYLNDIEIKKDYSMSDNNSEESLNNEEESLKSNEVAKQAYNLNSVNTTESKDLLDYFVRSIDTNLKLLIEKVTDVRLKRTDNETEVSKKELDSVKNIHVWNSTVKIIALISIAILVYFEKVKGEVIVGLLTLLISNIFRDDVLRIFFSKSKDEE